MAEDLYETLMRFHREVAVPDMMRFHREVTIPDMMRFHREVTIPDMQRLVREPLEEKIEAVRTELRSEMLNGFDASYKRIGIMETEMVLMRGAVRDLEKQVSDLRNRIVTIQDRLTHSEKPERFALRSEVAELNDRLETIQQRLAEIDTLLNEH